MDSDLNGNDNTGYLVGSKDNLGVGLTTLPHSCADYLQILESSASWISKGLYRAVMG